MKKNLKALAAVVLGVIVSCASKQETIIELMDYPETKRVDVVDTYFGVEVPDPFRWLEDDRSEETAAWVAAQNKVTFNYLEQIPFRNAIRERLNEIWDYPRYGTPFKEGDYYFFFKNEGMQNQSVLYIQEGLDGEPMVFLDPNKLSPDGTTSLTTLRVCNNARYLAYGVSHGGSDWNEFYVMDIKTGEHLEDELKWIKFSGIAWHGNGFYYSRYEAPEGSELSVKNENHRVYYHRLGTSQDEDIRIFENKEKPLRNFSAAVTSDETFLSIYERETTQGNALYVRKLTQDNAPFVKIADGFRYNHSVIDNIDNKLLLFTNRNAPMYKLVLVDPKNPAEENWKEIIPEKEMVLRSVSLAGDRIVAHYLKDASSRVYLYDYDGQKTGELALPTLGTLGSFSSDKGENTAFFSFSSFTFPSNTYKYDVAENSYEIYKSSEVDFDPEKYEIKQVFYPSKDGAKIPMFIVHKKGLKLDGNNPTLLYGYGGFNVSVLPRFNVSTLILLENGGIYAVANIRGGGEYGKEWHEAGTKLQKQNVFDDFIAAAEYLVDNKYTSSQKLAIRGGSNGGLLVAACVNQRPDLFQVALPAVGVMDMLRFHKFTIGWAWTGDYGSSEDSTEFHYLLGYSPLHNIKEGINYPATLVTTADHDDRVVPAHSFKYIAELQAKHRGDNPVLIRIETQAGHGAGKPTEKIIEEATDMWAFLFQNLGVRPKYKY